VDAHLHLEHLERLGQVVVAADLEAARLVLHVLERAEEHDGDLFRRLVRADPAAHVVAVDARGHHDVEQHEVGWVLLDAAKGGRAVERDAQLVVFTQRLHQHVHVRFHIVDDEDPALGEILHG